MKAALFQTPFIDPAKRSPKEVFRWAVDQAIVADQAGFGTYVVGEHALQSWESVVNPDFVVAAAALETENITLGPMAHILPYHHPAALALQMAWLDQILDGRYLAGVALGSFPKDAYVHGIKDLGRNRDMTLESLEIMQKIWKGEPFFHEGEFWSAGLPDDDPAHPNRDVRPSGKMKIGMTGNSASSPSIKFAGANGFSALSTYSGDAFVKSHWDVYSKAAAENGQHVDKSMHYILRDVFVAETDAEAKKLAKEGGMGDAWMRYMLPVYKKFGLNRGLVVEEAPIDPDDMNVDYLAEHVWLVGSPETVTEKLSKFAQDVGGFGNIMPYSYDYIDNPEPWNTSLHLLANEVLPKVQEPNVSEEKVLAGQPHA